MNKKLFIMIGVLIGIGLLALVFVLLQSSSSTEPPVPTPGTQGTGSPFLPPGIGADQGSGSATPPPSGTGGGIDQGKTMPIATADGDSIRTKDFIHDPTTIKDPVNAGRYQLGYRTALDDTEYPPYVIEFIEATDHFTVVLLQEPIAESRREAERYLMGLLGISESEMCGLRYVVSVPSDINQFYASRSLGFSFCPGSVTVPE